jgi:chorismate synthase
LNTFGKIFKLSIFGESHGINVGITIDGIPAGIKIDSADFLQDIERRKGGNHIASTPRKEEDLPQIISGIFNNITTGAPLTIVFENNNTQSKDYSNQRDTPRPGHADFVASKKFNGFEDYRGGGHFSGRLTLCLVAAGVIAKKIIKQIIIHSTLIEVGGEWDIEKGILKAIDNNDSVGGIVECVANNLPIGWGEPFFDSIESSISHLAFSVPAIKGIEFGSGFAAAKMYGSQHNDSLIDKNGKTKTNNSGGIVGGLSNGNDLIFRVAVKPTSSTPALQSSLNLSTNTIEDFAVKGRHDLCIALRVPVVIEAITAIALADFYLLDKIRQL